MTRSPGTAGEDFPEKRTSELTSKDKLGFAIWWRGKGILGRGNSMCKDAEAAKHMVCLGNDNTFHGAAGLGEWYVLWEITLMQL